MGANYKVTQCNCPECRYHRRLQILRRATLYGGITAFLAIIIGYWTYHNALEFAKLHEAYTISVFP